MNDVQSKKNARKIIQKFLASGAQPEVFEWRMGAWRVTTLHVDHGLLWDVMVAADAAAIEAGVACKHPHFVEAAEKAGLCVADGITPFGRGAEALGTLYREEDYTPPPKTENPQSIDWEYDEVAEEAAE